MEIKNLRELSNKELEGKIREAKKLDSIVHKFGLPGICCGEPSKRRTKMNRVKKLTNGSC